MATYLGSRCRVSGEGRVQGRFVGPPAGAWAGGDGTRPGLDHGQRLYLPQPTQLELPKRHLYVPSKFQKVKVDEQRMSLSPFVAGPQVCLASPTVPLSFCGRTTGVSGLPRSVNREDPSVLSCVYGRVLRRRRYPPSDQRLLV